MATEFNCRSLMPDGFRAVTVVTVTLLSLLVQTAPLFYFSQPSIITKREIADSPIDLRLSRTNESEQKQTKRFKPQLIIHIGPPKTATTTLQCEFMENYKLLSDHSPYRYIGKRQAEGCKLPISNISYPLPKEELSNRYFDNDFYEVVMSHLHDSRSPIYSSEGLFGQINLASRSRRNASVVNLMNKLKERNFETKIVIAYRRYYEWVPSYYRQKLTNYINFKVKSTPSSRFMKMQQCFASLQSYLGHAERCGSNWGSHEMNRHPVQRIQASLKAIFNNTQADVFNPHFQVTDNHNTNFTGENNAEEHMIVKFAHQMLDQSQEFQTRVNVGEGQLLRPLHTTEMHRIEIESVHLMVAIYKKELVPESVKPKFFYKWLCKSHDTIRDLFFQNADKDEILPSIFPTKCLSVSLQNQLLELSLKFESALFPEWSEGQVDRHRDNFKKFVESGKYCQWDSDAILENDDVAQFIRTGASEGSLELESRYLEKKKAKEKDTGKETFRRHSSYAH